MTWEMIELSKRKWRGRNTLCVGDCLKSTPVTCSHLRSYTVLCRSVMFCLLNNCIQLYSTVYSIVISIFSFFFHIFVFLCISLFFIVTSSFLAPRWARCGGAGAAWHKAGIRELRPEPRWNTNFKNDENCNMKIMKTTNISKHANCCKQ